MGESARSQFSFENVDDGDDEDDKDFMNSASPECVGVLTSSRVAVQASNFASFENNAFPVNFEFAFPASDADVNFADFGNVHLHDGEVSSSQEAFVAHTEPFATFDTANDVGIASLPTLPTNEKTDKHVDDDAFDDFDFDAASLSKS